MNTDLYADAIYSLQQTWLEKFGLEDRKYVYWQMSVPELVEQALDGGEGILAEGGALVCDTGDFTGRSPKDKFIVQDPETQDNVWWGAINNPMSPEHFDRLFEKTVEHLQDRMYVYVRDAYVCAMPAYRLNLRIITVEAWHDLFAHNLFLRPTDEELIKTARIAELVEFSELPEFAEYAKREFKELTGLKKVSEFSPDPDFTVIHVPYFKADPQTDGTKSENFVTINFTKKIILIGGTAYAGEMKKAVFTVLNYLLPLKHQVLPMHCSANIGKRGDIAIYFGLSGTGKTTLSADPNRRLIGDDEHGWCDEGVFNFEGGCYAKTINLSKENEPQIYNAIKFGAIVENMLFEEDTRILDFQNDSVTENIRCAYPLDYIPDAAIPSVGGIPENIFLLSCDAYGVLPPIAHLDKEQAIYYFLSGYTAKIAGTEAGIKTPQAVFSTCFGAPFLPLHPTKYGDMLAAKLEKYKSKVWLVNTGWIGGGYGVGNRIALKYTRALVTAALSGQLAQGGFTKDPIFQLAIPNACPGVPSELLTPRNNWKDTQAYDTEAKKLLEAFAKNASLYLIDNSQVPMG